MPGFSHHYVERRMGCPGDVRGSVGVLALSAKTGPFPMSLGVTAEFLATTLADGAHSAKSATWSTG